MDVEYIKAIFDNKRLEEKLILQKIPGLDIKKGEFTKYNKQ